MAEKYHYEDFHREMSKSDFSAVIKKLGKAGYRIVSVESKRGDFGTGRAYHFVIESESKINEKSLSDLISSVMDDDGGW